MVVLGTRASLLARAAVMSSWWNARRRTVFEGESARDRPFEPLIFATKLAGTVSDVLPESLSAGGPLHAAGSIGN